MAMLVTGNILIETEGTAFTDCLQSCFEVCAVSANPVKKLLCPFLCLDDCKHPTPSSEANLNEIDHTDYFCKLGCVTHRCASSSSIHDKRKFFSSCIYTFMYNYTV